MELTKKDLIHSDIFKSPILAILKCSSLVKFGKNKRGNSIYPCQPVKYGLPVFRVASKNKDRKDKIVLIQYLDWDKNLPKGSIIDIIGNYDDIDSKQKALINYYNIKPNKPKIKNIQISNDIKYIDKTNLEIFSIDPPNCKDIDDAMSCEINENIITVGIHIADVTRYLNKKLITEKLINQTSSLYPYNKNPINLWGEKITKLASLFPNKVRTSISLFFSIIDNKIQTVELQFLKIKSSNAFSYTEANTLTNIYKPLKDLIKVTNLLNNKEITNTKELVSYWMIQANKWIVIKMKEMRLPVIYRKHEETNILSTDIPIKIFDSIKYRWMKGAKYTLNESKHYGLGITGYTHFTSPIRRIADTCIHWIIKNKENLLNDNKLLKLNYLENKIKKYHRQQSIIEVLDIMKSDEILEAFVLDFDINCKIEIYLLKYDKFIKTYLFDRSIINNINIKIDSKLNLTNLLTNESYSLIKWSKINIKIRKIKSFLPKNQFSINIMDDKINKWFTLKY